MPKKLQLSESTQASTDPPGKTVFICCSKFSKPFTFQAAQAFKKGLVKGPGQIVLPDGQIITAGPTYETTMSPALIEMIRSGVLQASTFGKLLKRGGKACPQPQDTSTIPQPR